MTPTDCEFLKEQKKFPTNFWCHTRKSCKMISFARFRIKGKVMDSENYELPRGSPFASGVHGGLAMHFP